jgi:tripartite-type tricarboxylate transporter receptor subunit TctC
VTFPRRQFLHLAAGAAALPAVSRIARAQAYPTRPITMIVGFAAGGPSDTVARVIAQRMRASLGQPVLVENVVGASGSIAVGRAARAASDGYLLSFGSVTTHVFNGAVYPLQYDVVKDFQPVSLITTDPLLIVAKKTVPASDLKELIGWLKANPDKASQGTSGAGSTLHLAGILFQQRTGTRFQFVPYRGSAPAMQDLVAGQIDMMIDLASSVLPQAHAGTIKAYAVTSRSRLPAAPDIPTVDEAGLEGLYVSAWFALFAPKGTAKDIVARLNGAATEALADPMVRARFADLGQQVVPREQQTSEALAAYQKAEIEKWWPIIKAANIKPE